MLQLQTTASPHRLGMQSCSTARSNEGVTTKLHVTVGTVSPELGCSGLLQDLSL